MLEYVRSHLSARLLISYLAVIGIGFLVVVLASQVSAPGAFSRHMLQMGQASGMMMGMGGAQGFGPGQGLGQGPVMQQLYADFRLTFNEALMYAVLAAITIAVIASVFISRGVVAPVRVMMKASQRIAEGHYDERVGVAGTDELSQLAARFNLMAAKLEEIESMRLRLIGDVSHEMRTPLTAIKGSVEGLMDGVLPAAPETYEGIHAEADRLNRLVDDLQELSRVEAGAYRLDIRPVPVEALTRTVLKRLRSQFESKGVSLEWQVAPGLPSVLADEDRAVQVLTNLVGNALQYTPSNGAVWITARQQGGEVQFAIRDNGIGISEADIPHVFDRFYRVDKSRSRGSGGSGIGLTIARALVEAQGGRIWAASEGSGKGSQFSFTLPAAK